MSHVIYSETSEPEAPLLHYSKDTESTSLLVLGWNSRLILSDDVTLTSDPLSLQCYYHPAQSPAPITQRDSSSSFILSTHLASIMCASYTASLLRRSHVLSAPSLALFHPKLCLYFHGHGSPGTDEKEPMLSTWLGTNSGIWCCLVAV